jgi:RNA polymerase sigma-70 factor (ECF subfamily)
MKLSTEEAVKRYKDRLFIIAFNVCQNPADADDAVQDAFIKYDTFKKSFDDETHLRAWLIRVTINRTKDITSSFWRKHKETLEDYMENLVFEEPEDSRLFEVVMQLPEKYRVAM